MKKSLFILITLTLLSWGTAFAGSDENHQKEHHKHHRHHISDDARHHFRRNHVAFTTFPIFSDPKHPDRAVTVYPAQPTEYWLNSSDSFRDSSPHLTPNYYNNP